MFKNKQNIKMIAKGKHHNRQFTLFWGQFWHP